MTNSYLYILQSSCNYLILPGVSFFLSGFIRELQMSTFPASVCRYVWSIFTLNLCVCDLEKTCFSNGGSVQWADSSSMCCCKLHLGWQGMPGQLSPILTWMKYQLIWESNFTIIRESNYSENFDLDVFLFPKLQFQVTVKPSKGEHNQHGGHPPPTSNSSHMLRNRIYSITPICEWQLVQSWWFHVLCW